MTPDQAPNACPFCGAVLLWSEDRGTKQESVDSARKQISTALIEQTMGLRDDVNVVVERILGELYEAGRLNAGTNLHDNLKETPTCATAERERLTRERDESRERLAAAISDRNSARAQAEQVWKLREEFVDLLGTCDIQMGVEKVKGLLARVRQLESEWSGWPALQREWFGDRYAAMQPLDAVRARIEDSEARVKRLEEAGDKAVRNSYFPDRLAVWNEAKEAKP